MCEPNNFARRTKLLGSHTVNVPYETVAASVVCLSVPRHISKTKRDRREISLPL